MTTKSAIELKGFSECLRDFNRLPEELKKRVRDGSEEISGTIAREVRNIGGTRQARPLLESARAGRRERIPSLRFGGNAKAGVSGGAKLTELMGANFGSHRRPQFPRVRRPDYYVRHTIEKRSKWITRTWMDNLARALATVDPANRGRR